MCEPTTIMMGIAAVGSVAAGIASGNAAKKQSEAAAKAAVTDANFTIADLELARTEARDAALQELMQADIEASRLQSQVKAGLGETGLEGNSHDAVERDLEAQAARQREGIRENFSRESSNISMNQERVGKNTNSSLNTYRRQAKDANTGLLIDTLGNVAGAGLGYAKYKKLPQGVLTNG